MLPKRLKSLKDCEVLVRANFAPEHVVDGTVLPAAVSTDDLNERGFSVDRECLLDLKAIENRIREQAERAPQKREEAFASPLRGAHSTKIKSPGDGKTAFKSLSDPVRGNVAHAIILSAEQRSRGQLRALRSLLIPEIEKTLTTFEAYKVEFDSPPKKLAMPKWKLDALNLFSKFLLRKSD